MTEIIMTSQRRLIVKEDKTTIRTLSKNPGTSFILLRQFTDSSGLKTEDINVNHRYIESLKTVYSLD